MVNASVDMIRW